MSYGSSRRSSRRRDSDDSDGDWMISYSDVVTLLFAFLAIVLSVCKIDPVKAERVMTDIQGYSSQRQLEGTIERVEREVNEALESSGFSSEASVRTSERGLEVDLASGVLFKPGSANLSPQAYKALKAVVMPVLDLPVGIEIEGHTDSAPIRSKIYPSNWELSGARASVVVRNLIDLGFDGKRLKSVGLADTRPPKGSTKGLSPEQIMAGKRRVTLILTPTSVQMVEKGLSTKTASKGTSKSKKALGTPKAGPPKKTATKQIKQKSKATPTKKSTSSKKAAPKSSRAKKASKN